MTDNEITIKALKELLEVMLSEGDLQRTSTISHTIDLINRQKAENESLQRQLDNAKLHQKETHKTLQDEKALRLNEDFIKTEAYKEFAERFLSCYEGFDEDNEIITYSNLTKAVKDTLKELYKEDA